MTWTFLRDGFYIDFMLHMVGDDGIVRGLAGDGRVAIASAKGTGVTFHDETLEEAYESRKVYGAPDWQNDAWVSTYTSITQGEQARVSQDVETITGRPPTTLAEFFRASS